MESELPAEMEELRRKLAIDAFTEPQRKALGKFMLRPFTAGSRLLATKLDLTLFTGAAPDELTALDREMQFYAFLYIQSQPLDDVLEATEDPEHFRKVVLPKFMFSVDTDLLDVLGDLVVQIIRKSGASHVGVKAKPGAKAGPTPPKNSSRQRG